MRSPKKVDIPLETVLDTVLDGIITIDNNGIILSFNKAAIRMFDYQPEEVIGQNVKMLMPEPYHGEHDGYIKNYTITGVRKVTGIGREVTGRRKDSSTFPMSLGINEAVADGERIFVGLVRDISVQKTHEALRQRLLDKLTESNTELERFAYIASHDLQEPLRMVKNFSLLLLQDYAHLLDETGKSYLQMVADSGGRMRDMVEDLLSYSRVDNERATMAPCDGSTIFKGACENLQTLLEESKAKIIADPLPDLYGNAVQILRLLQNLIANAIKYQPKGNIAKVHISANEDAEYWRIAVSDNGIGIKPEFLEAIFQPFRRLHTWDNIQGTGLGLAICKKIVENHSGVLSVTSTIGKGSTFTFTIKKPVLQSSEAA